MYMINNLSRYITAIFVFISVLGYSQEPGYNDPVPSVTNGLTVKIELAQPKIFLQGDEIYINVKIFNSTKDETACIIADDKKFSFDFQMVTLQNRVIEHSNEYIISFHRVQPVFNSSVRLSPGEGYIYKARLNDYYDTNRSGQFFINCMYFPRLKMDGDNNDTIMSNQLSINIRPEKAKEMAIQEREEVEKEKKLFVTKRSPDEVVDFMLKARMKSEWEKFFLYMDLEKLILTNNLFKDKYVRADVEKQKEFIEQYKQYLMKNTVNDISYLPHAFKIVKTEYTDGRGKVEVINSFKYIDYVEDKYYTYFLYKKGDIWYVYSYEVLNLGIK